ncbi:cell adhesion molecule 1-like isoform X2 [Penaeus vannamei]|uniref:cell adhesion molecule 1-like isoform X2 n=1 Tax=Penaeus vannamei TaxID=6689 RepID=UPI00387FA778
MMPPLPPLLPLLRRQRLLSRLTACSLYLTATLLLAAVVVEGANTPGLEDAHSSPKTQQDIYDAAQDMWAKALALNTLAPEYQGQNNTEVTAQVGGEATFSCYTYHLSDDMVTWLKREDDQLLTVGQQVYVAEKRFSAVHSDHTEAWELWVKDVQLEDAGQYECQLTTHPPVSFFFTLTVTQAEAVISGPGVVHIEEGSHLAFECHVRYAPVPPVYIFWYHNGTMVNYGTQRALQAEHHNYTSSLKVARVTASDAGTYTCEPHLATPANVTVHVVTGKTPAAMQHGRNQEDGVNGAAPAHPRPSGFFLTFRAWACVLAALCALLAAPGGALPAV